MSPLTTLRWRVVLRHVIGRLQLGQVERMAMAREHVEMDVQDQIWR